MPCLVPLPVLLPKPPPRRLPPSPRSRYSEKSAKGPPKPRPQRLPKGPPMALSPDQQSPPQQSPLAQAHYPPLEGRPLALDIITRQQIDHKYSHPFKLSDQDSIVWSPWHLCIFVRNLCIQLAEIYLPIHLLFHAPLHIFLLRPV